MNTQRRGVDRQVIADGQDGIAALMRQMKAVTGQVRDGETLTAYAGRRNEIVAESVRHLLDLLDGVDAFDVLDLMRQREVIAARAGYPEENFDASAAVVEVVAVILLARGRRSQGTRHAFSDRAYKSVEALHTVSGRVLSVASMALLAQADATSDELSQLAAHYQGAALNIRNKQYSTIQNSTNEALFGGEIALELGLGFTYANFVAVRESIDEEYLAGLEASMNEVAEIAGAYVADKSKPQDTETVERGRRAFFDSHVTPGRRASFTAVEISRRSGVEEKIVATILELFSVDFVEEDATSAVIRFLDGDNPFATAGLVRDAEGNFLQLSVGIGTDYFRQSVEAALKGTPSFQIYNDRRKEVSESLSVQYLEKALHSAASYAEFYYFAPKKDIATNALGIDAVDITSIGQVSEADALFIIDDVAICVEVKASSFAAGAKSGNAYLLRRDLEKTIGSATAQAHRLENLIEENGGLWLRDRTWLDLSQVREVRSIAVCLDDLGPLATGLDALVRGGIITDEKFPWIVSLHDLAVVATVLERAPEFLLYLRRRTEPETSRRFNALDELDLFMLFLQGGLYLEPDPDLVYAKHPMSMPPTVAARKRFAAQAKAIRVHTHTDPLDAWMERDELPSDQERPAFRSDRRVLELVDFLEDGHKPGWFRFAADLLNLSGETQKSFAEDLRQLVKATRADHVHHSMMLCFAGAWGFPSLFVYTRARGVSIDEAREELEFYMVAKKHQLRSDRALGVILDESDRIIAVRYANGAPRKDAELDDLVKAMRLVPVERMARAVPPSAKRATKRLQPKKKK